VIEALDASDGDTVFVAGVKIVLVGGPVVEMVSLQALKTTIQTLKIVTKHTGFVCLAES
jgi:hypothetical protein